MASAGVKVWECAQTVFSCHHVGYEAVEEYFTPGGQKTCATRDFVAGARLSRAAVSTFENYDWSKLDGQTCDGWFVTPETGR